MNKQDELKICYFHVQDCRIFLLRFGLMLYDVDEYWIYVRLFFPNAKLMKKNRKNCLVVGLTRS